MVELNIDIPEGFLKEEEKCGYLVTAQQKEIWAIEIDLLMQLDRVCKKHELKYCVGAGTLLGAVRHHGFIPWDDDIDVYMLRRDYDKLMELTDEFQDPYLLQNIRTEKKRITYFSRLRNTHTTGATVREIHTDICMGLFVDIFPLDGISPDKRKDQKQSFADRYFKKMCRGYNLLNSEIPEAGLYRRFKKRIVSILSPVFFRDPEKLQKKYDDNLKKYSIDSVEMVGNRTLVFECPKSRRPKTDYEDLISMPFEFVEVPAPRAYDSMLRQQYGDYMKIPEDKKGNMHGDLIISTDYAYNDPRRTQKP